MRFLLRDDRDTLATGDMEVISEFNGNCYGDER